MNRTVACLLGLAALAAAGCGGPMMAGAPGQLRPVTSVPSRAATPVDPAMCMAPSIGDPNAFGFLSGIFTQQFRSVRLLTRERPDPAGCDLIFTILRPGSSVFSRDELKAYSGFTGELLWEGASTGDAGIYGISFVLSGFGNDFLPGQPYRQKLDEEAATGRHVAAEDLNRLGIVLASETSMKADTLEAASAAERAAAVSRAAARPAIVAAPAAAAPRVHVASDLDSLPAAAAVSPRRHAVVIGVERYRENLPKADFAASDARLAAEYFKRVLGVPEQNLALLVDERAAKSDFEKYFERWLPNRVEAGDEVFVYFSGHGAPNPSKGDAYLVPYDGDPTYIDQTGYPLKRMYEQLGKLPAKSAIVAMDSCFSGAGGRSVLAKGARPLVTVSVGEALPARITVLAASAGDQTSNTYQEKGHGLFTYFLLKGLKDRGPDMKGVFEYLKPEVARTARRELNSDQDPQWREGK